MGLEDLQRVWRTPSQVLWGRRTSNGSGGPPMGLEDLQQAGGPSDGSGGPPTGLEDPKSGSMGLEDIYGAGGPPMGLEDPKSGSMGQEDLQRVWRTSNGSGGPPMGLEDLQWIWRTPSQDLWV